MNPHFSRPFIGFPSPPLIPQTSSHTSRYRRYISKTYLLKTYRKTKSSKMTSNQQSLPQAIPIATAQHAYYHSPLGSPTFTDGSFLPVSQSKSNDLVSCVSHEERPGPRATNSWGSDRKSTESEDSKRPAFRRTGRHSGDWLFGGFSFRQTARRVLKNFE